MEIAKGLNWLHIYWVRGATPTRSKYKNAVSDPPCSGWQHALVLSGEKRSTIFCPYTFEAYTVPNSCLEIATACEPKSYDLDRLYSLIKEKWKTMQEFGWQRDYDTCTLILKRLGLKVPKQIMTGGGEDNRKKGGKDVGSALLKPVKASSKRGKFLQWFLDNDNACSVREVMIEFSMTRSNALSYLYMLQKDHGIGYILVGDIATVELPAGCDDPFDKPKIPKAEPVIDDDDDWLN